MMIQELNQEMWDEGIEIGRAEGRKEGRAEERIEMIRNVLYTLKNAEQTAKILRIDTADVWSVVKAERIPVDDYPNWLEAETVELKLTYYSFSSAANLMYLDYCELFVMNALITLTEIQYSLPTITASNSPFWIILRI